MNKYYTPELEEFHYGFEYEQFEDYDVPGKDKEWHKFVYGENGSDNPESLTYVSALGIKLKTLRVKYLDREDIEELGFVFNETTTQAMGGPSGSVMAFDMLEVEMPRGSRNVLENFYMTYAVPTNWVLIWNVSKMFNSDDIKHTRFCGKVKNKSELKRILNQIGVQWKSLQEA